jgi:hypothetical protein
MNADMPPPPSRPTITAQRRLDELDAAFERGIAAAREKVKKATDRTRRHHVAGETCDDNCRECRGEGKA